VKHTHLTTELRNFIDTGAGVIDADYRGQVKVLLFNHSDADFPVSEGDRVAQLVLERIYTPEVLEVAELEESVRGAGGFGSTGGFGTTAAPASNGATDGASDAPAAAERPSS
jgi:deoxyuridine 5'-triphosphate nucleotidohydrolase